MYGNNKEGWVIVDKNCKIASLTPKRVYVIGHKNPDVDAVASAIAYAGLKSAAAEGREYVAAVAGELNAETRFVLEYLGLERPALVTDVGTKVEDLLEEGTPVSVRPESTLLEVGNLLRTRDIKTLPVVDDNSRLLGLLTVGDVAQIYLDNLGHRRTDIARAPEILSKILSSKVAGVMKTRNLVLFERSETVDEAKKQMLATRFRNYPVVDEDNRLLGMISRYHMLQMKRKQVILVDHNEKKQAVEGIEEAEILEIVDHHRVGDLQTISPIFFRNEPVGATCTLVAGLYHENGVVPDKAMAGLLLAGILSDTMIFKSPTTTAKDRRIAGYLAEKAGLSVDDWGREIFRRTGHQDLTDSGEVIREDLKEYQHGDITFAISQVETIDLQAFKAVQPVTREAMEKLCARHGYQLMLLMVTDIFKEGTELLAAGPKKEIVEKAFGRPLQEGGIFLEGVMSRKKQVVPVIYKILAEENMLY